MVIFEYNLLKKYDHLILILSELHETCDAGECDCGVYYGDLFVEF